tara:strand:- start:215 stop:328 length:114 start_codon:yes stop_codon:yes gene_type:complete
MMKFVLMKMEMVGVQIYKMTSSIAESAAIIVGICGEG